ncbi:MAG: hypothetical protein Q8N55_02650 [bacterium]|nr:hypothetical protein [bacterium]
MSKDISLKMLPGSKVDSDWQENTTIYAKSLGLKGVEVFIVGGSPVLRIEDGQPFNPDLFKGLVGITQVEYKKT